MELGDGSQLLPEIYSRAVTEIQHNTGTPGSGRNQPGTNDKSIRDPRFSNLREGPRK